MDQPFELETVDRLLSTTRAVRRRLDLKRPVSRATLVDCVRLSQQAPSAESKEQWRWLIIDDADTKCQIAEVYRRGIDHVRELEGRAEGKGRRMYESTVWLAERLEQVPALVFPCLSVRPSAEFATWNHGTVYASILPAVWSFQLALRSRGLGSTLTTMHLLWENDVAEILGIPEDAMQAAMLPVAYTVGIDFKATKRRAPEEIISYNGWSFAGEGNDD